MKKYVRPDVFVTEFQANEAVALCETTTQTNWPSQTITCVVDGDTQIFYDGCTESASNGILVYMDDPTYVTEGWYYVWYNGNVGTQPSATEQKMIDEVLSAPSVNKKGTPGWHAGLASNTIISIHNHS